MCQAAPAKPVTSLGSLEEIQGWPVTPLALPPPQPCRLAKVLPQTGGFEMPIGAGSWARRHWTSGSWSSEVGDHRLCQLGLVPRRRKKGCMPPLASGGTT